VLVVILATALGNNYLVALDFVNNTVGFICLIILGLNQLARRNVSAGFDIRDSSAQFLLVFSAMNEPRRKQRGIVRSPVELHSGY